MKSYLSLPVLLLAAALLIGVNLGADRWLSGARIDLTQDKLFTLSPGTRQTMAEIEQPITLRFFMSERLMREAPTYAAYGQRVRDMLREFSAASGGKLIVVDKTPSAFSEEEDQALKAGLQGVPIDATGELIYFGLAGEAKDGRKETIPFFTPERESFLEYDLARLVYALDHPKKAVVGILATLPVEGDLRAAMQGLPTQPWVAIDQIKQLMEVRNLTLDVNEIPEEVTVLLIIHPEKLPQKTLYAIDQYFLKGGHGLIFVDPLSEVGAAAYGPAGAAMRSSSDLKPILDAWGVILEPDKIVADGQYARRINAGMATETIPIDYPGWISLPHEAINNSDNVTANLEVINVATAGALRKKEGATLTFEPLLTSSDKAALMPAERFQGMPDFQSLLRDFKPTGQRYTLAARVRGNVVSAFPDGPPKEESDDKTSEKPGEKKPSPSPSSSPEPTKPVGEKSDTVKSTKPHLTKSAAPLSAIIVADTDLLEDRFWVDTQEFFGRQVIRPNANNGDFAFNAVENLAGSDALIGLRSRGVSQRPFERIIALQKAAELRLRGTEQALQQKVADLTRKLAAAQPKPGAPATPTPAPDTEQTIPGDSSALPAPTAEQTAAIAQFQSELLAARQELRTVRGDLRKDIRHLERWVQFINIALMPIFVAVFAIGLGLIRHRQRRRRLSKMSA
ncbi:MAG: Gldg family protein [Alphaproteobacteria bacterium]